MTVPSHGTTPTTELLVHGTTSNAEVAKLCLIIDIILFQVSSLSQTYVPINVSGTSITHSNHQCIPVVMY